MHVLLGYCGNSAVGCPEEGQKCCLHSALCENTTKGCWDAPEVCVIIWKSPSVRRWSKHWEGKRDSRPLLLSTWPILLHSAITHWNRMVSFMYFYIIHGAHSDKKALTDNDNYFGTALAQDLTFPWWELLQVWQGSRHRDPCLAKNYHQCQVIKWW